MIFDVIGQLALEQATHVLFACATSNGELHAPIDHELGGVSRAFSQQSGPAFAGRLALWDARDRASGPCRALRCLRHKLLEHDPEKHVLGLRPDGWVRFSRATKTECVCAEIMLKQKD